MTIKNEATNEARCGGSELNDRLGNMTLDKLPTKHKDRNMPLSGFYYKWKHGNVWLEIKPTFAIAKKTYNELGAAWTDNDVFIKVPNKY